MTLLFVKTCLLSGTKCLIGFLTQYTYQLSLEYFSVSISLDNIVVDVRPQTPFLS